MRASPDIEPGGARNGGTAAQSVARGRALLIRMAFVGSAACGILLTAGAAAHADEPDATAAVSSTIQTVSTTTSSTTDAVGQATETVGSLTDELAEAVGGTTEALTETATSAIDDTVGTAKSATDDVSDAVAKTLDGAVDEAPIDPVIDVVHDAAGTQLASPAIDTSTGIDVRSGASVGSSTHNGAERSTEGRRAVAALAAGRSKMLSASPGAATTAPAGTFGASSPTYPSARPRPAIPAGASTPALPSDAAATAAFALALIGVILLRFATAPPIGWRRHAPPTTPFHGAAVALAVERPG